VVGNADFQLGEIDAIELTQAAAGDADAHGASNTNEVPADPPLFRLRAATIRDGNVRTSVVSYDG
jgi:hypothetical protein